MKKHIFFNCKWIVVILVILLFACHKEPTPQPEPEPIPTPTPTPTPKYYGHITFRFTHNVDGVALQKGKMIYTNEAGNNYQVDQVMYFVSNITLIKSDGTKKLLNASGKPYYINAEKDITYTLALSDTVAIGDYNKIMFTFGVDSTINKKGLFLNPPELNMEWPEPLGGGFHHMMINGRYKDLLGTMNLNFHLGRGRDTINNIAYIRQNNFQVVIPNVAIKIETDKTKDVQIIMNIESWFKTPTVYNIPKYGQSIMQNQEAMGIIVSNGFDVFTIGEIK